MKAYYSGAGWQVFEGECVATMRLCLPDNSVDSIVTDPPYDLTSSKRKVPAPHNEASPFSRHRMGVNGDTSPIKGFMGKEWDGTGVAFDPLTWKEVLRVLKPGGHILAFGGSRTYHRLVCAIEDAGFEIRDQIAWVFGSGFPKSHNGEWGGTALKPAHEPICVARKPLIGTVEANWRKHGTGALNIDGCRVPLDGGYKCKANGRPSQTGLDDNYEPAAANRPDTVGRWPANLIHDGSDEVTSLFPNSTSGAMKAGTQRAAQDEPGSVCYGTYGGNATSVPIESSSGNASRFFYCAKTSKRDRNEGVSTEPVTTSDGRAVAADNAYQRGKTERANPHPTVKPTDLMRYLCRLVTPPGGTVLDPFMGSGSTGKAALLEDFQFIGIEREAEYAAIAVARLTHTEVKS